MTQQTVLIIRHADKPDAASAGVDGQGAPDDRSLTPLGWQRAGVWAELFRPSSGAAGLLPAPVAIFASAPGHPSAGDGSKSRRPLQTITPLADKLGLAADIRFTKGQENALAAVLAAASGVTLVCWQHENIGDIARGFHPAAGTVPADWPGERFNIVFRLTRDAPGEGWRFDQLAPVMLKGDVGTPI